MGNHEPVADAPFATAISDAGVDLSRHDRSRKEPPPAACDWESEYELAHLGRVLHRVSDETAASPGEEFRPLRFDPPSLQGVNLNVADPEPQARRPAPAARRKNRGSAIGWLLMALGLMAFACGGVLLGWSHFTARGDLWELGLPINLGGQCGLLLGLVLLLERLWRAGKDTTSKLDAVDHELDALRKAAAALGGNSSGRPHAFYGHLATGASPQVLLADLRGQLEILADKISRPN